jgi:hypothetical protein
VKEKEPPQMSIQDIGPVTHVAIPRRWLKWCAGLLAAGAVGAWTGGAPTFLIQARTASAKVNAEHSDHDNREIIDKLDQIIALRVDIDQMTNDLRDLKDRVNRIEGVLMSRKP